MEGRLHAAALEGECSFLELLREDPLILDRVIVSCVNETPLYVAVLLSHLNFVRELLRRKPELALETDLRRRQSPLHLASAKVYVEIVKELLLIGPNNCFARDRDGNTPLHLAAMKGRVEVLKVLVQAKPQATRVQLDRGGTILHLCVKYDRLEALKLLLESVGDYDFVNLKDDHGNTVLHLAVADKQIEIIKLLLNKTGVKMNSFKSFKRCERYGHRRGPSRCRKLLIRICHHKHVMKLDLQLQCLLSLPSIHYPQKGRTTERVT